MSAPVVGTELEQLHELQGRALDAVARRWAGRQDQAGPGSPRDDAALRRAAVTSGLLADAARQTATAAAQVGWTRAVEVADAVSTTAQALRMLAEIELSATPGA